MNCPPVRLPSNQKNSAKMQVRRSSHLPYAFFHGCRNCVAYFVRTKIMIKYYFPNAINTAKRTEMSKENTDVSTTLFQKHFLNRRTAMCIYVILSLRQNWLIIESHQLWNLDELLRNLKQRKVLSNSIELDQHHKGTEESDFCSPVYVKSGFTVCNNDGILLHFQTIATSPVSIAFNGGLGKNSKSERHSVFKGIKRRWLKR